MNRGDSATAQDGGISPEMLAACYADMRRVARRVIAGDRMAQVIQPTELANEAAIRLIRAAAVKVEGQAHLLALAARTMRRVLIDESRKGSAAKRHEPTMLTMWPEDSSASLIEIGDLDRALLALEEFSPEHAQVVELRFMLGMTVEETALASGIPERTIKRRWQAARAWLLDYLKSDDAQEHA